MTEDNNKDNVVDFTKKFIEKLKQNHKERAIDKEEEYVQFIKDLGDGIDVAIDIAYKDYQLDAIDIAAVLGHRLGTFINLFSNKEKLYLVVDDIVRKQGKLIP